MAQAEHGIEEIGTVTAKEVRSNACSHHSTNERVQES